jgi:hypothetical protein
MKGERDRRPTMKRIVLVSCWVVKRMERSGEDMREE